jgi:hypothetical protein
MPPGTECGALSIVARSSHGQSPWLADMISARAHTHTCAPPLLLAAHTAQVVNRPHLLTGAVVEETVALMVRRLALRKSAIGMWELFLDRSVEPWLFNTAKM